MGEVAQSEDCSGSHCCQHTESIQNHYNHGDGASIEKINITMVMERLSQNKVEIINHVQEHRCWTAHSSKEGHSRGNTHFFAGELPGSTERKDPARPRNFYETCSWKLVAQRRTPSVLIFASYYMCETKSSTESFHPDLLNSPWEITPSLTLSSYGPQFTQVPTGTGLCPVALPYYLDEHVSFRSSTSSSVSFSVSSVNHQD